MQLGHLRVSKPQEPSQHKNSAVAYNDLELTITPNAQIVIYSSPQQSVARDSST